VISWRALLEQAQPLTVDPVDVDRSIARLRGLKLRGSGGFSYSKRIDNLALLRAALAKARETPLEANLLDALLRQPLRVYPLRTPAAYGLMGAWRVEDQIEPRIGVLSVEQGKVSIDLASYAVGDTDEELASAMERLYLHLHASFRMAPDATRRRDDRVLWIGGSDAETGDPNWRARIEAVLTCQGFEVSIREQPGKDSRGAARAVSEVSAVAVISWVPRLGSPHLGNDIRARCRRRLVEIAEYDFNNALDELRLILEDDPLDSRATADEACDEDALFDSGGPYFFKKIAKRGRGVDLMIHRRDPCGHDSWRAASAAPQARKGIERLAQRHIRTLEHCNGCQGGGMWRVHFD
jgi:hypothetical protein